MNKQMQKEALQVILKVAISLETKQKDLPSLKQEIQDLRGLEKKLDEV
jgi:hypothetical protein